MEEQKNKTVEMPAREEKNTPKKEQRYSYEELNNICIQLQQQNQKLVTQLRQMDISNAVARLNYLFKVVECANASNKDNAYSFTSEFVESCIKEIEETISIPEDQDKKEG